MMLIEDFLNSNPTKEEVAERLCEFANSYVLDISKTWLFELLSEKYGLTIDDFYDDQSEFTYYERHYIGLYNWKYKGQNHEKRI